MTTKVLPFNIDTCEEDFAGPGRRVEVVGGRRGFHVKFDNGWVLSVQFGWGHYHTGRDLDSMDYDAPAIPSLDAEVAAWKGEDGMIEMADGDSVAGWQPIGHVLAAISAAARDDEAGIRAALIRTDG